MPTHTSDIPLTFSATDKAMIDAYRALSIFRPEGLKGFRQFMEENYATDELAEIDSAMLAIEAALPVWVLMSILPAYTKIRYEFCGRTMEGQIREGAWGLYYSSRGNVYPRRVTTTNGFEFWFAPDTEVAAIEILERAK